MATWIDFRALRESVRIADVLRQHDVHLKVRGEKATGLCPLPTHPVRNGGKRTASFSVHLGRGIWHCFGCGAKGNALDLSARLQGLDPEDPIQFRKAALNIAETFGIRSERSSGNGGQVRPKPVLADRVEQPVATKGVTVNATGRVLINEPIDFELKHLDAHHPYLSERGLMPDTIAHFGLGFCSRGMMSDRIAIPLHDPIGRLVGYAGRLVDDDRIDDEHPRYLFPGTRERNGVIHEFRKSQLVYNLHRLGSVNDVLVVEGFASVWWLWQNGYGNIVSLMGNSCSAQQADLVADHLHEHGRIWLMPDGNEAGRQLAAQALPLLAVRRSTRLIKLEDDRQPTDCDAEELVRLLGAIKSGTSKTPHVANVDRTSNGKAFSSMAAEP